MVIAADTAPCTRGPAGAEPVIPVRDLRMRYGSTDVLGGADLRVRRGGVVALLRPNGAGKTTTLEILEGFRQRSAGEVRVLGTDPNDGDEAWRARLGIVLPAWRDHGKWRVRDLIHQLSALPEWLQWLGQVFPLFWLGLGLRSALLPNAVAAAEVGGSWRPLETIGVLGAWPLLDFAVAPVVLRRLARRASGACLAAPRA